jgi:hypothetical protein
MRYFSLIIILLSMFTWIACGHGRDSEAESITQPSSINNPSTTPVNNTPVNPATVPTTTTSTQPQVVTLGGDPKKDQVITTTTQPVTTISQPVTTTSGNSGPNPAHGQPGHRCDIPVGSPLNSKPTQPTQPTVVQSQPTTNIQPTTTPFTPTPITPAQPTTVASGINPAHGQPGHRCDIPVGSPLNSKPTQPTVVQTQPSVSITPSTPTQVKDSTKQ